MPLNSTQADDDNLMLQTFLLFMSTCVLILDCMANLWSELFLLKTAQLITKQGLSTARALSKKLQGPSKFVCVSYVCTVSVYGPVTICLLLYRATTAYRLAPLLKVISLMTTTCPKDGCCRELEGWLYLIFFIVSWRTYYNSPIRINPTDLGLVMFCLRKLSHSLQEDV